MLIWIQSVYVEVLGMSFSNKQGAESYVPDVKDSIVGQSLEIEGI